MADDVSTTWWDRLNGGVISHSDRGALKAVLGDVVEDMERVQKWMTEHPPEQVRASQSAHSRQSAEYNDIRFALKLMCYGYLPTPSELLKVYSNSTLPKESAQAQSLNVSSAHAEVEAAHLREALKGRNEIIAAYHTSVTEPEIQQTAARVVEAVGKAGALIDVLAERAEKGVSAASASR